MQSAYSKYFIAIVPPEQIADRITELKHYVFNKFKSKAALRSPPHITLHMPFLFKTEKEDALSKKMSDFCATLQSFHVTLNGFDHFSRRVIFVKVLDNEKLIACQREVVRFCRTELNLSNANYKDDPFHAHITIAFRDLSRAQFESAWDEFKDAQFEDAFLVDRIVLLKHNGHTWDIFLACALIT